MRKQEELNYPRVMMVSNDKRFWAQRVVFMEKAGQFLAWSNAETIEEAEHEAHVFTCKYAKEIEEPKTIELTMQEIADKFGCSTEQLKIKL